MPRKTLTLIPLPLLLALDVIVKMLAIRLNAEAFVGPFGFAALMGERNITALFTEFPMEVKIVALSTTGALLLVVFGIVHYLTPHRLRHLQFSFGLIVIGILGNVIDYARHNAVTNVFIFRTDETFIGAFNIADLCTLSGIILTGYFAYLLRAEIWPEKNLRREFWINPEFQAKYTMVTIGIGTAFAAILFIFAYSFLLAVLKLFGAAGTPMGGVVEMAFVLYFLFICLIFILVLLIFSRHLSHRIAGPVYGFQKYVQRIMAGEKISYDFKVREGDEFRNLEPLANDLRKSLRK